MTLDEATDNVAQARRDLSASEGRVRAAMLKHREHPTSANRKALKRALEAAIIGAKWLASARRYERAAMKRAGTELRRSA